MVSDNESLSDIGLSIYRIQDACIGGRGIGHTLVGYLLVQVYERGRPITESNQ